MEATNKHELDILFTINYFFTTKLVVSFPLLQYNSFRELLENIFDYYINLSEKYIYKRTLSRD